MASDREVDVEDDESVIIFVLHMCNFLMQLF